MEGVINFIWPSNWFRGMHTEYLINKNASSCVKSPANSNVKNMEVKSNVKTKKLNCLCMLWQITSTITI
jgi:hypothetical protein